MSPMVDGDMLLAAVEGMQNASLMEDVIRAHVRAAEDVPEADPDEEVKEPKWAIAQLEPGTVNHVWWAIVDTANQFVRGRWYGRDNAQLVVDLLNDNDAGKNALIEEIINGLLNADDMEAGCRTRVTMMLRGHYTRTTP